MRRNNLAIHSLILFALSSVALAAPPSPSTAQAPAEQVKGLVHDTYRRLATDPAAAERLFHFGKAENARLAIPVLADVLRNWQRVKTLAATRCSGAVRQPRAAAAVAFPLELPEWVGHAHFSVRTPGATLEAEDDYDSLPLHFQQIDGTWMWNGNEQFSVGTPFEASRLTQYLKALRIATERVAKAIETGALTDGAKVGPFIDRELCLELLGPTLTDSDSQPAPKLTPGERRLGNRLGRLSCLAMSADGRLAVTGAIEAKTPLRLWDVQAESAMWTSQVVQEGLLDVWRVAFTPDGREIVVQGAMYKAGSMAWNLRQWEAVEKAREATSRPFGVWVVDSGSGKLVRTMESAEGAFSESLALSPDGAYVAATGMGTAVWSLPTGKLLRKLDGGRGVTFLADATLLVLGFEDRISVVDVTTGQTRRTLRLSSARPDTALGTMAVSADTKTIAYGTYTGVVLLDADTGRRIARLPLPGNAGINRINHLAFSDDDSRVLACTGLYALDDGESGGLTAIVPTDRSRAVYVWDVQTRRVAEQFCDYDKAVSGIGWGRGEKSIISSSTDGTLRIWPVSAR